MNWLTTAGLVVIVGVLAFIALQLAMYGNRARRRVGGAFLPLMLGGAMAFVGSEGRSTPSILFASFLLVVGMVFAATAVRQGRIEQRGSM